MAKIVAEEYPKTVEFREGLQEIFATKGPAGTG